jgi:NADH-quinone oxidoreductase subunit B
VRWFDWYGDGSLLVVDVGLACCALEFEAATMSVPMSVPIQEPAGRPEPVEEAQVVVVVSGTVTDRLAPAVAAIVDAAAGPGARPKVVSFGACATSGGPYWDSYAVTKGVDQLVEVDIYVPGCPPPPEALHAVLDQLAGRVGA